MAEVQRRRSPRIALPLPIRVYGTDFTGTDFVEDSTTIVVNHHGAKIRLTRQLLPDQEIVILSVQNKQEAVFRVVAKIRETEGKHTFWGVEIADPKDGFWGVEFPSLQPEDQRSVRITLECPQCRSREQLHMDERLLESIQPGGGLNRLCPRCGKSGLWKQVTTA
jgi:hypothetical protein